MTRNLLTIWAMAGLLALAACSEPAGEARSAEDGDKAPMADVTAPAADHGPVVVMLGDSLTAGFGLADEEALPARLEARLKAEGLEASFVNAGVSGDTTGGGLERYDWSVKGADPDLLILALGANDYLTGVAPETAEANLTAIIERAKADGLPIVLVGLKPRSPENNAEDIEFGAIYPRLAEKFSLPLYPAILEGVRDDPQLLKPDGLHATAAGIDVIAGRLATFLKPEIEAIVPKEQATE